jgi:hypothetical protein
MPLVGRHEAGPQGGINRLSVVGRALQSAESGELCIAYSFDGRFFGSLGRRWPHAGGRARQLPDIDLRECGGECLLGLRERGDHHVIDQVRPIARVGFALLHGAGGAQDGIDGDLVLVAGQFVAAARTPLRMP